MYENKCDHNIERWHHFEFPLRINTVPIEKLGMHVKNKNKY